MAPSANHPLGSSTKGSRALLSPMVLFPPHRKVLCQVPACWWREGLKVRNCRPTVGSAPSRLVTSPRRHSGRSSTNISRRRLPGPRSGLVSSQLESDQQTSQQHLHKVPKRSSLVVTSPRRHSSPSRPTSQTASPWAAQWACGSSQKKSDQHPQLLSTSHQSGRICCFKCRYCRT